MRTQTSKKPIQRQRPERKLHEAIAEAKGGGKGLIDKQFTAFKAVGGNDGVSSGLFDPTPDDMEKINQFTLKAVGPEEVACFNTLSCNDLLDRDDDRFTKECVDDFAKLDGPLSSVGKSYMVGHDYTKLPVGRIFDVGTTDVEGIHFLTNKVYVPRLAENESFIANQEFGIYWAVSVGVMLEESECSVCQSPMIGNLWVFCMENGHEKGLYYDPDSEEKDAWGWAEPVDPDTKGAVKCTRELFTPKDFYELSQVFLGAQYDAQIGSKSVKGILKAASANLPILNLGHKEAKELPIQHVSEEVREAYAKGFEVQHEEDGSIMWTDDSGLVWSYDPSESEVLCLGEKDPEDEDNEGGGDGEDGRESKEPIDEDASGSDGSVGVADEERSADSDESEGDEDESDADSEEGLEDDDDDEDDEDEEEAKSAITPKALKAAVSRANLPNELVSEINAKGGGLTSILKVVSRHIKSLEPRAALGAQYVEAKRAEALKWYVKAQQTGGVKKVKTKTFKTVLERVGDDVDLINEMIEEQMGIAQAKFPASVRRSTVVRDPEDVEPPEALPTSGGDPRTAKKVRRLHG